MTILDDALRLFQSTPVTARMYRGDVDLGAQVNYEPEGVMKLEIAQPRTAYQARFTQAGVAVLQDDEWVDALSENPTLELYRLLDPRTFTRLLNRARRVPGSAGQFHLSFYLEDIFGELQSVAESGMAPFYTRETKVGNIREPVPESALEWITNLVRQPRYVVFYVAAEDNVHRLSEMAAQDLDPDEGLFSLRFSYG